MNMQMDLLGLMAKPLRLTPLMVIPRNREPERWQDWWKAEQDRIAAGTIERVRWGDPRKTPNYTLELWHGPEGWRWSHEWSTGNAGSTGQFHMEVYETRAAAMVAGFRYRLRQAAKVLSGCWNDSSATMQIEHNLADWMIRNCSPLDFGGINLAAEFSAMQAEELDRECRRRKALCAAYDASEAVAAVTREFDAFGYSGSCDTGIIHDPDGKGGGKGMAADPAQHALEWPAYWSIAGHSPSALRVIVYPSAGQRESEYVGKIVAAIRERLPYPVELVEEGWSYPLDKWTWDER